MYTLSTDYPALYDLLLEGEEVACWVIDTNQNRRILSAKLQDGFIWLAAVEVTYRQLPNDTDYFTSVCEAINLSYIPPSKDIAEKSWDAATDYWTCEVTEPTPADKREYLNSL